MYMNKRWGRENDMRDIIRNLAENGEKMVQLDRSRDYKEDFDESESDISDLYMEDSDEEWNEVKRKAIQARQEKSNKIVIKANADHHIAKNLHTIDRVERNDVVKEEKGELRIESAYEGPPQDEL